MLREKEFRQEPVHLKQAVPVQNHLVIGNFEEAPINKPLYRLAKPFAQFHAEF
jgi:hypothetical protein